MTVKTGSLKQIREVEGGSGGKGQNSLPVEFGLGSASVIDSLTIRWQSGTIQSFTNVGVNQIITIIEGQSIYVKNLNAGTPEKYILEQNYPNPFNQTTVINYQIPLPGRVILKVYDISGKEIAVLLDSYQNSGGYSITFNADKLTSGIYFYNLQTDNFTETKKMILVK